MTTYDRHQAILTLLTEQASLKVTDLAAHLNVSEGTIRNDLSALESQKLLKRVRGGAIPSNGTALYPLSNDRARINAAEKKRIARWAAELVNDGDVILLDASSTVLHMATFLQDRRDLTVITNQLEAAQILARDPSKTVILVGGVLKVDGTAVKGSISVNVLKELHIAKAFVSCVACSLESGLMEADIDEADYKVWVASSASQLIALLDSSKFAKTGLKPFASIAQIDHIVTDDGLNKTTQRQLQALNVRLTLCGEHTVQSLASHEDVSKHIKLGFANLSEHVPFAVDVRRGLERAVKAFKHVDLIIADNNLDSQQAVNIAEQFIAQDVDLIIEYHIDEATGNVLMERFRENNIPVIAVDIPIVGATFFGVNNYQAGFMAGEALGKWLEDHWQGQLDGFVLLEEKRAGPLPAARLQGQLKGLEQIIGPVAEHKKYYLDSGNTTEQSYQQVINLLEQLAREDKLAFLCFNDDAALGAFEAVQEAGRLDKAAIIGQGAERRMQHELARGTPALIASTAFNPEQYGDKLLTLALQILKGESVPPAVYIDHKVIEGVMGTRAS
ncbi:MAG: substrate-binding domain-containing protein [Deinococcota bacterium]